MTSARTLARIAGSLYLIAVCGGFAELYVRSSIVVPGDAAATADNIAQMFFGLWLLPLGYLVVKSGYFPKALGVLLAIGCFGYLADLFARFLAPAAAESIAPLVMAPAAVGELSFIAWLLVKAVRVPERNTRVPAIA
jgi:hypothetical protein